MGHFEEALRRDAEAHRLEPRRPLYAPLVMGDYVRLDRYAEAKATAAEHFHQGFDHWMVHQWLLRIAWIEGDEQAAARQLAWFAGSPEEYVAVGGQALHAGTAGRLRESRELIERSVGLAQRRGLTQAVARIRESAADAEALTGNCMPARIAFAASPAFTTLSDRLATLAFCGDAVMEKRAQQRTQEISRDRSADELWSEAQLPSVRAAIEYRRGNPREADDLLQKVKAYERAIPFAVYLRGLAFLKLKQGRDAAMEFRNLTDHKGANWGPLYPLTWLGLARASALAGDTAGAGNSYREFLAYWKNADSEIPVLDQARMEYEQLK
jgi:predicted Zn-dependent protease